VLEAAYRHWQLNAETNSPTPLFTAPNARTPQAHAV